MAIRVIQVGFGGVGRRRADVLAADDRVQLVGVVDPSGDTADEARRRYGDHVAVSDDYAGLIAELQPDAVVVSTPNDLHAPAAMAAFQAGAHVLVEKPLTTSADSARELVQAAGDRLLGLGANHMAFPSVAAALERVARGDIGPLQSIRIRIGHGRHLELPDWCRSRAEAGGGTLIDNGSHAFLLATVLLAGDDIDVTGCDLTLDGSVDINAVCELRSAAGVDLRIESTWVGVNGYLFDVLLTGSTGCLKLDGPARLLGGETADDLQPLDIDTSAHSWVVDTEGFITAVERGEAPPFTGAHGLRCLELIEASYARGA